MNEKMKTCGNCPYLDPVKIGTIFTAGCKKTGNLVPQKFETGKPTIFWRVPVSCPLPDDMVFKSEVKADREDWVERTFTDSPLDDLPMERATEDTYTYTRSEYAELVSESLDSFKAQENLPTEFYGLDTGTKPSQCSIIFHGLPDNDTIYKKLFEEAALVDVSVFKINEHGTLEPME